MAELAAAGLGACFVLFVAVLLPERPSAEDMPWTGPEPRWRRSVRRLISAADEGGSRTPAHRRRRVLMWTAVGAGVWAVTGWPVAGVAVVVAGVWLPWLLGSARAVQERLLLLESLEAWCRRMADTLTGGGAIGLTQAITTTADRIEGPVASPVRRLARQLQLGRADTAEVLRDFADDVDDRAGDAVAAALLLALHQQSIGVAQVLRQLADGVAGDVRARRDIEAARAESRQSMRMLLVIQTGLLVLLALVPSFAAPYGTATGQVVMGALLAATVALLVWMRRLSLGRPAPRFLGHRLPAGAP